MEGWIKLYRKSLESIVFQAPNLWMVWCYCLIKANHKPANIWFNNEEVILKPGQFITGRFKGAKDCNMSSSTYRDQLIKLKRMRNLDIKSDNKKSLVTILNWEVYQTDKGDSDINPANNPTPGRHRQECKNEKKDLYGHRSTCPADRFAEFWSLYPKKIGKKKALQAFLRIRDIDNNIAEIIKGLNSYIQSDQWLKDGGQYIPHPSTWLTQERWKDELPAPSAGMLMSVNSFRKPGNIAGRIIQLNKDY